MENMAQYPMGFFVVVVLNDSNINENKQVAYGFILEVTNFLKLSLILNLQYICLILKLVLSYFLLTVYLIILCVCVWGVIVPVSVSVHPMCA